MRTCIGQASLLRGGFNRMVRLITALIELVIRAWDAVTSPFMKRRRFLRRLDKAIEAGDAETINTMLDDLLRARRK